jgi:hypothetical protein
MDGSRRQGCKSSAGSQGAARTSGSRWTHAGDVVELSSARGQTSYGG